MDSLAGRYLFWVAGNVFVFLLLMMFAGGCEKPGPTGVGEEGDLEAFCSEKEERQRLESFILECTKNAGQSTTEDGDDLVEQCEETGIRVICPVRCVLGTDHLNNKRACPP